VAAFYLDEPVAEDQASALRQHRHNVVTTRLMGNKGNSDVQQLLFATRSGRILITYDLRDYPILHEAWHELARLWGVGVVTLHPGIVIIPPTHRLAVAEAARVIHDLVSREDLRNRLLRWKPSTGWVEISPGR
jgi:hypothetical protein